MFILGFPLLVIPFAIYNMIAFLTPGVLWTSEVLKLVMTSGAEFILTAGDVLIAFSLLILFVEVLKATRMSRRTIMDHVLSMMLFIALLVEFLLVKQAATGTFFLLLVITFIDVIGGFSVTIRTSQRNVEIGAVEREQ
jgi:hypothetical protein